MDKYDNEKTARPDTGSLYTSDKTIQPSFGYNGSSEKGEQVNEKTGRPDSEPTTTAGKPNLAVNDDKPSSFDPYYVIDDKKYTYLEPVSTGETGEADILLVEKNGEKYALKLYKGSYSPKKEILEKIKALGKSGFVVPLYSYGTVISDNRKRAYELMKYIPGKSLSQVKIVKDEILLKKIVMNASVCIDFCHKKGILHKDIKPGNFFYVDDSEGSLMLADFGISDLLDKDGFSYSIQSGTTTYNAPEMYTVAGNEVRLNPKSDFYSLGILLMSLWMGEAKFRAEMGDKAGKGRVFDLRLKKVKGNLPYPADMSENMLLLIKGLTIPDEEKRWGFNEVVLWSKGQIMQLDTSALIKDVPFLFDESKGLVANSPEELAEMMSGDREYAIKILKRGKVTGWLQKCNRDRMATEIDDIVNSTKNNNACVMMSVYRLDPNHPYYGAEGRACANLTDLALEITGLEPGSPVITDQNSDFHCFLKSHKWNDKSTRCAEIVKTNTVDPQWEIAYTLDPMQPYMVFDSETEEWVCCDTPEEIVDIFKKRMGVIYEDEPGDFLSHKFYLWLRARDEKIFKKFQNETDDINAPDTIWCLLYNLDLKRSYELTLSIEDGPCHKTDQEIAELINYHAIQYYCINKGESKTDKDFESESFLNSLSHFDNSRLYYYLKSKGHFQKQIEWIKFCYELNSKTNTSKCSPYYESTATWKVIKGLMKKDQNPAYFFPKSNEFIRSLNELTSISRSEIQYEMDKGFLAVWLTLFFHEDPYADLNKEYNYEKLTDRYLNFIKKIHPGYETVRRYQIAHDEVVGKAVKTKRNVITLILLRLLAGVLFFLPLIGLMLALAAWGLPFKDNPMPRYSSVILFLGVAIGIILFLYDSTDGFLSSILGGVFIALLLYYGFYLLLSLLMPVAPWVIIGLLATLGVYIFRKCYLKVPIEISSHRHLFSYSSDIDNLIVQPLFFAFKSDEPCYRNQYSDEYNNYNYELRGKRNKLLKYFIPSILIVAGLIFMMARITPALGGRQIVTHETGINSMKGSWSGTFDGKEAVMNISDASSDIIRADISVKFNNLVTDSFSGRYSKKAEKYILNDNNPGNGILDGYFSGITNDNFTIYKGVYRNNSTGKEYEFEFGKDNGLEKTKINSNTNTER